MPTTPYAKALVSVNAGGNQSGGLTVAGASTIQLSGESVAAWESARWEIYGYPLNWPTPSGGTLDGTTGIIYSTSFTPSIITLEAAATRWGKWLVRLIVNGGTKNGVGAQYYRGLIQPSDVVDTDVTGWQVLSPTLSLLEPAIYEQGQFSATRQWVDSIQKNFKALDTAQSALAGDVTGPIGANVVEKLTGLAGVVNFPIGNKLTSTGASNVGDIITTSAGSLILGNQTAATATDIKATTTVGLRVSGAGGFIQLTANGGSSAFVYSDSDAFVIRTGATAEAFRFTASDPSFKLDSVSGTFPATGLIRTKYYAGAQVLGAGRLAAADAAIVSQNGTGLTFGQSSWGTVVLAGTTVTLSSANMNNSASGYVQITSGVGNATYLDAVTLNMRERRGYNNIALTTAVAGGSPTFMWGENLSPTFGMAQRVGDNATRVLTIAGQAASATATVNNEDGGHVNIKGGVPDGAGVYGLGTFTAGIDRGYNDYPWPADADQTLTAA